MLCELRARQLGVIEDLSVVLGPGMTALTGETGAGKTLVVEALELLTGGRCDPMLVRPGHAEASVEGRFVQSGDDGEDQEVVLARVVPARGRSRAYVDGQMASLGVLGSLGVRLVDLHGQHAHQSLLSAAAQRRALDSYAGVSTGRRDAAAAEVRRLARVLESAGGDASLRQREADFLRFQLAEIVSASLEGPDEDDRLAAEEATLADAGANRAAAAEVHDMLSGEDEILDRLGRVVSAAAARPPLAGLHERLASVVAELADAAGDSRRLAEQLEEDPRRLAEVVARRGRLRELRRKYGGPAGTLAAVVAGGEAMSSRLVELEGAEQAAARAEADLTAASDELRSASAALGLERRQAAERFAGAVETELRQLAMPRARFEVRIGPEEATHPAEGPHGTGAPALAAAELRRLAGEDATFVFAANAGEPVLPLARTASGGELARAMLAVRLVLQEGRRAAGPEGPGVLVFDEVDAGIGGEAAVAVGAALARLARRYQVIVITHLAQVAAFAQAQVVVRKTEVDGRTVSSAALVDDEERVVELSRMLSGQPASETARSHARELLALAGTAEVPARRRRQRARPAASQSMAQPRGTAR